MYTIIFNIVYFLPVWQTSHVISLLIIQFNVKYLLVFI